VSHRHRTRSAATALVGGWFAVAVAVGVAVAVAVLGGGCAAASVSTPGAGQSSAPGVATPMPAASAGAGSAAPTPGATITDGPVPSAALQAATRYWRLVGAHRYHTLLAVVTPDSQAAAAIRAGRGAAFWGIKRVGVVSAAATVLPAPPAGAGLEFSMTVRITPGAGSAWSAGQTQVFMSLRRIGGGWLVYESGPGP
jgi:hypothetical protein